MTNNWYRYFFQKIFNPIVVGKNLSTFAMKIFPGDEMVSYIGMQGLYKAYS